MASALSHSSARKLTVLVLLLSFSVRGLVPQGFMPAGDGRLSLEICPEGFPTELLPHSHHHHSGSHWAGEHCVFGSAGPGGPLSHFALPKIAVAAVGNLRTDFNALAPSVQLVHLPHARGPPVLS